LDVRTFIFKFTISGLSAQILAERQQVVGKLLEVDIVLENGEATYAIADYRVQQSRLVAKIPVSVADSFYQIDRFIGTRTAKFALPNDIDVGLPFEFWKLVDHGEVIELHVQK
jgi:hypothetical protein